MLPAYHLGIQIMKKIFTAAAIISFVVIGFYYWGNVHTLESGVAYRSAQLFPTRLKQVINEYGIKSVLNLRGKSKSDWYQNEVRACHDLGVVHNSWKISALRRVSPNEIAAILRTIKSMPKPILIHCQGGADRTGLISAAWKFVRTKGSVKEAREELSPLYGHIPWFGNETIAMDKSFDRFVENYPKHMMLRLLITPVPKGAF